MSKTHAVVVVALALACCSSALAADILWSPDLKCPTGARSSIVDLSFKNQYGAVALQNGDVWLTQDRGDTWTIASLAAELRQPSVYLTAIARHIDRVMAAGLIAGETTTRMMAYSEDGGATWRRSNLEGVDGYAYWHIAAIDVEPNTAKALAVGYYFPPGEERGLLDRGYHLSRPLIMYTEDGGANWRKVGEPEVASEDCIDLTGARLRSEDTSWICGRAGTLCAGRPPFESWSIAPFPESDARPRLTTIYSLDDRFWVTRTDGKIMRWQGGAWDIATVSPGLYLQDAAFLTDRDGVAIGYTSIFHTTNGGSDWEEHQLVPDVFLFEFDCLRCVGVFSRHSLDGGPLFSYRVGAQHPGASSIIEPCLLKPTPMLRLSPALLRGLRLPRHSPLKR